MTQAADPTPRADAQWRRGTLAVGISLLFHALAVVIVLATLRGAATPGDTGSAESDGEAINVSLGGPSGSAEAARAEPARQEMTNLFNRLQAEQSDLQTSEARPPPRSDLQELISEIDEARAALAADLRGRTEDKERADAPDPGSNGDGGARSRATASAGDLWGQIKPCWDRMPGVSTVPVTLEVTLNDRGVIAKPPEIARPAGARLDEQRLISEARALAALTACSPYRDGEQALTPHEVEVRFAGAWKGR